MRSAHAKRMLTPLTLADRIVYENYLEAYFSGLISSLVISGYGYGSLIWIPMETAFVNPDNVDPGEDGYYDDQDLLER